MFIFASVKLYINTIMETTNITKQNPIQRLLEYKRAMRECIQRGADHEEMKKITNDYGFTLATPVWMSIYFKNNNPNKQQLIKSFNDLMSRDIYEIVVWLYSIKSLYTLFI